VKSVTLPKYQLLKLKEWAKGSNEEICGFLFGYEKAGSSSIVECSLVKNIAPINRGSRFLISPEDYLKAEEYSNSNSLQLLGVFHSHIGASPNPSITDVQNSLPGIFYLIISIFENSQFEIQTWELQPCVKLVKTIIN